MTPPPNPADLRVGLTKALRGIALALLLAVPLPAEAPRTETALQQITREAEERLRQWDEEDAREEARAAREGWWGFLLTIVAAAFGRATFTSPTLTLREGRGASVQASGSGAAATSSVEVHKKTE